MHEISEIKKKSVTGVIALSTRTLILQAVTFVSTFILTVLLTPEMFGVYFVVSAVISFLTYFSDIGLAAALIQKHEDITDNDLSTTFTIQQILVLIMVCIGIFGANFVVNFYKLPTEGIWLYRALVAAFFLSSLKTIPSVVLERRLEFSKLIIPQLFETIVFYAVAIILAWLGFGINSFTWAVIARAVIGLFVIYLIAPWKIRISISQAQAKKLLTFGIPFQANSLLALLKDDLMTVFLGKILPFSQIGYIGWAKKWAEVPLRLILDSVVKVTFPAFSRIQHSQEMLTKAIEITLSVISIIIFPATAIMLFFAKPIVLEIPRYAKWEPAIFSLGVFAVASAISSMSVPLTNILNAVGRIKTTLKFMILWTVGTWCLTIIGIHYYGYNGVSLANLMLTLTIILVVQAAKKSAAPFSVVRSVSAALIGTLVLSIFYKLVLFLKPVNIFSYVILIITGIIIYIPVVYFMKRKEIREIVKIIKGK